MEKIRLANNKEYQAKDFALSQDGEKISFTVCGVPDYPTLRLDLSYENLSTISIVTEGGAVSGIYEGYTQLGNRYGVEESVDGILDITVYLSMEDEAKNRMDQLRADLDYLAMMGGIEL